MLDKTSAGNRAPQHRQTRRILQTFAGTFGPICPWSSWSCRLERQWWGAMQSWAADMLIADVFYDSMRSMEWQCHAEPCRCRVDIRQARPTCVPCADRSCSSEKLSCRRCSWSATLINYIKLEFPNFVALWIQKQASWLRLKSTVVCSILRPSSQCLPICCKLLALKGCIDKLFGLAKETNSLHLVCTSSEKGKVWRWTMLYL